MRARANYLRWPVCVLFLLAALCTSATGEVIYVDDDAAGANDGSSWSDAFTDLQDALAAAQEGDEIRVAQGVYTPTQNPLDRDATFGLKDGVSITGGYAGPAGMYPDFRHTKFFTTILSGDIDHNDDIVDPNTKEGNSHHVVTCTGGSNAAVLEGVAITGGYSNMTGGRGGHGSEFGAGGGLYCERGCSPQLIDCVFTDNYAEGGGAVYMSDIYDLIDEGVSDEHSWKPVFERCIFTNNDNRAVSCGSKWHPEFINCIFENNSAGAISAGQSSTLKFNNCVFRRNTAGRNGGAISTPLTGCEMQFFNCLFEDNNSGFEGGAVSLGRNSTLEFNHCVFRRNTAGRNGGAVYTNIMSEVRIINCLFVANTANDSGGAIACRDSNDGLGRSSYKLINSTFYGNTSPTFFKPPTNVVIRPDNSREYYSASIISNCIFYNSIANDVPEIPFPIIPVSFEFGRSEPLIITSIYERGPELGGDGTVPPTPDPLFVDPYGADGILGTEDDDFRLAPDSPAIDSGTNETFFPLLPMDLDGYPRIINDIVDLGVYESIDVINVDDEN
jgi:predicted outer membrane repeat protein